PGRQRRKRQVAARGNGRRNRAATWASGEFFQRDSQPRAREVDPADHAGNECLLLREFQEPAGFLLTVGCLDDYRPVDTQIRQDAREIAGKIISSKDGDLRRHPRIVKARGLPKMLVSVDNQSRSNPPQTLSAWPVM